MNARAAPLFDFGTRNELAQWSVAGALVLTAHFGLAAAYLLGHKTLPEGSPEAPIMIVELAPSPVAPASEQDIAIGPPMQEVKEPEPPPPKQEDAVVAEPPKVEPKPEKRPPAPRTTAAPRNLQHTASIPAAPAPGSASVSALPPSWISLLFSHLLRYRQYPQSAQAARQEGIVMLTFTMDRNGHVLSRHVARSSGVASLDAEALSMIERAQPLPSFPPGMPENSRSFTAPIKFSLR